MSGIVAGLLGAGCMVAVVALGYGLWWTARKLAAFFAVLQSVNAALRNLDLRVAGAVTLMEDLRKELEYLRIATSPPVAQFTPEQAAEISAAMQQGSSASNVIFPQVDMSRFARVPEPDAAVEDTDMSILKQTDADMIDEERMQSMRDAGIEVDPTLDHPGIQANSE